jgi:superfamily I DNA/RNA helicase
VVEERRGAISVFDGPEPQVRVLETSDAEGEAVGAWIAARVEEGVPPEEIVVFVRSEDELRRGRAAVAASGLVATSPAPGVDPEPGKVSVLPMHQAKGLEFRAVAVMACDDDIVPLQARIEAVADEADLEEVYNTERHLLYVACTRARDHLLVTGIQPGSEFLGDMVVASN